MKNKLKIILNYIFLALQLLIFIQFTLNKRYDYLSGVSITTLAYIIFLYVIDKYNLYISNYVRGGVIVTILSHHILGEYFNLYSKSAIFDKALHIFGTYAFTLFIYLIMIQTIKILFISKISRFIFVILLGISIGVGFEVIEFILDVTIKPKVPYQSNLIDTNLDIVSDIVGSIIAAFYITIRYHPKSL